MEINQCMMPSKTSTRFFNEPLISGQGNFGSIDGDPVTMRYTETKLGKISQFLTEDLEKNTVNFRSNYDETERSRKFYLLNSLIY